MKFIVFAAIVIIIAVVTHKVIKNKQEKEKKRIEAEEREQVKKKAEEGDSAAQMDMAIFYEKKFKETTYYLDKWSLNQMYYWLWVTIYNGGNPVAIEGIKRDLTFNLARVDSMEATASEIEASKLILRTIKEAEEDVHRHRRIYKSKFPNDIGNMSEADELHTALQALNV